MSKSEQRPVQVKNTKFQLSQKSLDVLSMGVRNLSKMSLKEQKITLRQLFQTANRRIKSLEKLSLTPTALRHVNDAGLKKFSLNVTEKELHKEYAVLQDFFAQKSSTVSGAKSIQKSFFKIQALKSVMTPTSIGDLTKEQVKTLNEKYSGELTEEAVKEFANENISNYWDLFHEILETNPNYNSSQGSPVVKEVFEQEYSENRSPADIRDAVERRLSDLERESVQESRGRNDVFSAGRNSF